MTDNEPKIEWGMDLGLRAKLGLLTVYEIRYELGLYLQGVYRIKKKKIRNRTRRWCILIGDFEGTIDQDKLIRKACATIVKYAFEREKDLSEEYFGLVKDKDLGKILLWEGTLEDAINLFGVNSLEEAYEHIIKEYKDILTRKKDIEERRWKRLLEWLESINYTFTFNF